MLQNSRLAHWRGVCAAFACQPPTNTRCLRSGSWWKKTAQCPGNASAKKLGGKDPKTLYGPGQPFCSGPSSKLATLPVSWVTYCRCNQDPLGVGIYLKSRGKRQSRISWESKPPAKIPQNKATIRPPPPRHSLPSSWKGNPGFAWKKVIQKLSAETVGSSNSKHLNGR